MSRPPKSNIVNPVSTPLAPSERQRPSLGRFASPETGEIAGNVIYLGALTADPPLPNDGVSRLWSRVDLGQLRAQVGTVTYTLAPGGGWTGMTIQDEGGPPALATAENFVGDGVSVAVAGGVATILIPGGGGSGHIIQEDGAPKTAEPALNFLGGFDVTDVPGVSSDVSLNVGESPLSGLAKLAGRSLGQSLRGGLLTGEPLNLLDGLGATRLTILDTVPQVKVTGDLHVTGKMQAGSAGFEVGSLHALELSGAQSVGLSLFTTSPWPNPAPAGIGVLSVGGICQIADVAGYVLGLDFLPSLQTGSFASAFYQVNTRAAFGNPTGLANSAAFNVSPPSVSSGRRWLRSCGYRIENLLVGNGLAGDMVARVSGYEVISATAGSTGVRWPNRFGMCLPDLTTNLSAPERAFGYQVDAFDAVAVGKRYPYYYGDFLQAAPTAAWFNDISVGWVNNTAEAATPLGTPFNLFNTDSVAQVDWNYIGYLAPFEQLAIAIATVGASAGTPALSWEYSLAAADTWAALTVTQDLGAKPFARAGAVSWTPPTDWASRAITAPAGAPDATARYWVRFKVITAEYSTPPTCYFIQLDRAFGDPLAFVNAGGDIGVGTGTRGLILKDTQATPHYWRVTVSTLGVLTTTDLGTTIPA